MYEENGRLLFIVEPLLGARPVPAYGGRSERFDIVDEPFDRFVLPNPCGARPESVTLPCAFQLRPPPFAEPRAPGCVALGGRFAESCDMRLLLIAGLPILCALTDAPPAWAAVFAPFIARTDSRAAALDGAVRAITLRFCTPAVGRATFPRAFAAPK